MFSRLLRLSLAFVLAGCVISASTLILSSSTLARPLDAARYAPPTAIRAATTTSNLLINPDFEDGYYFYPGHDSIRVPLGWGFVWYTDTPPFGNPSPFMQPEVSVLNCVWPNCNAVNYPPRINTGLHAVESGKRWGNQDVTLYQSVGHIPIGARVSAEAWVAAWVSSCDPNKPPYPMALSLLSDNASGCQPGAWPQDSNHMLVGIDPSGGSDPRAPSVVWNWDAAHPPWWGPYDYYSSTVPAVAVAQAHTVTLFLRGVTVQPAKFNTVYFDTARLTYDFPITWQIDRGYAWPLSSPITIGLQTPISLTQLSVALQDPIGDPAPIDPLGSSVTVPYTLAWRFVPAHEGTYRFTVTAHELPDPLVQQIESPPLPFHYWQDRLLVPSDTAVITCVLSSPITLTNLSALITNPTGLPLTTTLVSSDFVGDGYNFVWQFTAEASGLHTITVTAAEFIAPFVRRVVAATARIYLPLIFRNY
jgi:hypothetical protein